MQWHHIFLPEFLISFLPITAIFPAGCLLELSEITIGFLSKNDLLQLICKIRVLCKSFLIKTATSVCQDRSDINRLSMQATKSRRNGKITEFDETWLI